MKVERLSIKNFRNIQEASFEPDPGVNFLVGANGQGKTSFLEALGFLSTLRSFRESKTAQVIRWGASQGEVHCNLAADSWRTELKVQFQWADAEKQKATKVAFVNQKPFRSSTQYLSQRFGSYELGFHSIIFNPSDHDLVRGDPAIRRSYLDRVLAAENVQYLRILQKYQRTLQQRNALLKTQPRSSHDVFLGFTESLCHYGTQITRMRLQWVQRLVAILQPTLQEIAPLQPPLNFVYLSSFLPSASPSPHTTPLEGKLSMNNSNLNSVHFSGQGDLPSLELLEQSFWTRLSMLKEAEWKTGHTLVGPHRDDWAFFLGDQPLKGHGSQGEVRSALLALKLSEIVLFQNETGHRPLFLLDDFSSELDRERRLFLLRFLMETGLQTFVTTTEDSSLIGKKYWVSNGAVKEGKHDDRTKAV